MSSMTGRFNDNGQLVNETKINPENVLRGAMLQLEAVVLVGRTKDGKLYVASSDEINSALTLLNEGRKDMEWRLT